MKRIKKAVAKIEREEALWAPYGAPQDGYTVVFGWEYDEAGRKVYYASHHKGLMPAFNSKTFSTAEELAEHILDLQPDMRRWRTVQ